MGLLPFLLIGGAPRWDIDKRDEDWLQGGANEMEIEDGFIRVYGVERRRDSVHRLRDQNLIELVRMYKENSAGLKRWRIT